MVRYERKPSKSELNNEIKWLKVKGYSNIKVEPVEMGWIKITADEPKKEEEK